MRFKTGFAMVGLFLLTIVMTGCEEPTKATGGGRIDPFSFYASTRATFGFNGDDCDGPVQGKFTFVDNTVSSNVRLSADVTSMTECTFFGCGYCFAGELVIDANYTSNVNNNPGSGSMQACLRDSGNGQSFGNFDGAFVVITSGPFAGYAVEGNVSGNITNHDCD